ncbi:hypothetical protein ACFQO4_17770 [Saliphagus sp. GCM10025334]
MAQSDRDRIDPPDPELRFDAGSYEGSLVNAIIVLRGLIGICLILTMLIWTLITANSIFSERSVLYLGHWIPVILAMAAAVYLLGKLYE